MQIHSFYLRPTESEALRVGDQQILQVILMHAQL